MNSGLIYRRQVVPKKFVPPTESEVRELCEKRGYPDYSEAFIAYHGTRGWIPKGSTRVMSSWQHALTTFHVNAPKFARSSGQHNVTGPKITEYTIPPPITGPEPPTSDAAQRFADSLPKP